MRRDHHEWTGQFPRHTVHRHLPVAHGFQQRGLGPRRSTIDLVAQNKIVKDRPRMEFEASLGLIVNRASNDVRWQKVRRELNPRKGSVNAARHCFAQRSFAHARHVFQEYVFACDQRDHA